MFKHLNVRTLDPSKINNLAELRHRIFKCLNYWKCLIGQLPATSPLFQIVFAAVLAVAAAAPSELPYERDIIEILRQNIDHNDDQSYQHSWVWAYG